MASLLEVIAKAPVAEHFEEGVVIGVEADVFEVVVFAAGADAFLGVGRARRVDRGMVVWPEKNRHELVHARVGEKQIGRIRQQARRRDNGMPLRFEKIEELVSDLAAGSHCAVTHKNPVLGRRASTCHGAGGRVSDGRRAGCPAKLARLRQNRPVKPAQVFGFFSAFARAANSVYSCQRMKRFATITVIGKDKTGVIARVTNFLFQAKANIEALEEQVTRGQFSMTLQASWKTDQWNPAAVETGLGALARELAMEIKMRSFDPSRLQRAAILVTRESHCFAGLAAAFAAGELKAELRLVLSNRSDLAPLARQHGLPFVCIPYTDRNEAEKVILQRTRTARDRFFGAGAVHEDSVAQLRVALQEQNHQHSSVPAAQFSGGRRPIGRRTSAGSRSSASPPTS